jgi:hypothetical protein
MKRVNTDKSAELTLTFSEQQWLSVGTAISMRLGQAECGAEEAEDLGRVAIRLQQVINRIWRASLGGKIAGGKVPVVNFGGRQEVDEEYLYGGRWD